MHSTATYDHDYTAEPVLYLALELDESDWKLGFTSGLGKRPHRRSIAPRGLTALEREIRLAKKRFGMPETARVVSCYEAGRDGFWLHRYLCHSGVENLVVDAASIETTKRRRRLKTDRVDLSKLLRMLVRHSEGEQGVWSVVRVPSVEAEDRRQLHRECWILRKERNQHLNRIKGLLATQGVRLPVKKDFPERLKKALTWDGSGLPPRLINRLLREYVRLQFVERQKREVEQERTDALRHSNHPSVVMVRSLMRMKSIDVATAWPLVMELFSWRKFSNPREIGGLLGLAGVPRQSGETARDQGMSKEGNSNLRALVVELAWCWLRYQPDSELSRWYQERYGQGSRRMRKIGIVALARKLLVALWHYLEWGEIPKGALLKPLALSKRLGTLGGFED